jgi:hypothetical protein
MRNLAGNVNERWQAANNHDVGEAVGQWGNPGEWKPVARHGCAALGDLMPITIPKYSSKRIGISSECRRDITSER